MTYAEFWPRYLEAHGRPATRGLHYLGTSLALACLAWAAIGADWRPLPAAPILGYGFAWAGHFFVEGNRPETFRHPLYSLLSDLRMLALWVAGRLSRELARLGPGAG
ncbi:MAG: Mpo1-like protein [Pseudomonadota bacterium]